MLHVIVRKHEKVLLSTKPFRADWFDKICVDKLVKTLCFFLYAMVMDFYGFSPLTAIIYKIIWFVDIVNIESFEILLKRIQIQMF